MAKGTKEADVVLNFRTNGEVAYSKTIKQINNDMKMATLEYKNQMSAMDRNASATEKLTATKQKLEKQLEIMTGKTQGLREEYEKSVKETGEYSEKSQKLKEMLLKSETSQNNLRKALESTNEELSKQGEESSKTATKLEKLQEVGDKAKEIGKKLSVGVTAPIMAMKAASVKAYEDMRGSQAKLINQTGKTGEEAEKLKQSLKNLYGNSAKSSDDLAEALGTVTQRFDTTGKTAEDMTLKFLTFARVNNTDTKNSIEKVSRAMGDAGIPTSEYASVLDLLTVASQKSGIQVDSLAENLAKYGAPMRQLGFDTKTSVAMFASWEKAGVNTEIAFSGMKKAISTWGKEGKKPLEEFPKAMEKIKNSTNPVADAIAVFGAKAGPDLADAIKEGRFSFEDMVKTLDSSSGKLDEIGKATGNPMSKMTVAAHQLNLALMPFGEIVVESMIPAVKAFAEFVTNVVTELNKMDDSTRDWIVRIALVVAAIGPALIMISSFVGHIQRIVGAIKAVQVAFSTLSAFLAANPFVLVIAGIALLIAAFVLMYQKVEWFRDGVNATLQFIAGIFIGAFQFIAGGVIAAFSGMWQQISAAWEAGKSIFDGIINFVTGVFSGNWSRAWKGVVGIFKGIVSGIAIIFKAPINTMIGLINTFLGGLNFIKIPKWVPKIGGKGFSIPQLPYLANGGSLINGSAIVGEAGPELLSVNRGKTTVTPLSDKEKREGISGKQTGTTIEQHINIGSVDANNPSELDRLNRKLAKASKLAMSF